MMAGTQELPSSARAYALLRSTDMYRVLRADQEDGSRCDAPRVRTRRVPLLRRAQLWLHLRTREGARRSAWEAEDEYGHERYVEFI
jgi:hypothetical protein